MKEEVTPNLAHAREMALMAHNVVIKLKEAGLPDNLDTKLAHLSTDLGDIWGTQKLLADSLEGFLKSPRDWSTIGDHLVDIMASVDHIAWHLKSIRRPLISITQHAYRKASAGDAPA